MVFTNNFPADLGSQTADTVGNGVWFSSGKDERQHRIKRPKPGFLKGSKNGAFQNRHFFVVARKEKARDNIISCMSISQPSSSDTFALKGVQMAYVFAFDLGSEETIPFFGPEIAERLKYVVGGCFSLPEGRTYSFQTEPTPILKIYKDEMYDKRFRRELIHSLQTLVVEFEPVTANGLSHNHDVILSPNVTVKLKASATLHRMGVGSLVIWIEPSTHNSYSMETVMKLRDASGVRTGIDWRIGKPQALRLNGNYAISDIARFLIINLFLAIYKKSVEHTSARIQNGDPLNDIHTELCKTIPGEITVSSHLDVYPIYHVDYKSSQSLNATAVSQLVEQRKAEFRGLITGDLNWDKKKPKMCEDLLNECDYTTRDSIRWYTHQNGSLKIYSADLETDIDVSKALIVFELEFVVTMRHFAYSILRNLDRITDQEVGHLPIKKLAKLRDREMRRLDEFYNLDFLQKDTTLARLEKYKGQFRINNLFHIAMQKFESLNLFLSTQYQEAGFNRTLLLSIVFGVFATGQLIWGFLMFGIESGVFQLKWNEACLFTLGCMSFVGIIIYLASRLRTH